MQTPKSRLANASGLKKSDRDKYLADHEKLSGTALVFEKGRVAVDGERRTSVPGLWAGGDCIADGSDLTVVAVADGKKAAASIIAALQATTSPLRAGA